MSFNGLGKKCKRILAFLLAAALFFNAWIDYGFSVLAEGEEPDTTPTTEWSVELSSLEEEYNGNDLTPAVIVKEGDTVIPKTDGESENQNYTVEWKKDSVTTTEVKDAGSYTVEVTRTIEENYDTKTANFTVKP